MGPGDEIALRFEPKSADPAVTYFLRLTGWAKDLDCSTTYSQTVEPLPFKEMSGYPYGKDETYPYDQEHIEYLLQYNTRAVREQNEPLMVPVQY